MTREQVEAMIGAIGRRYDRDRKAMERARRSSGSANDMTPETFFGGGHGDHDGEGPEYDLDEVAESNQLNPAFMQMFGVTLESGKPHAGE